MRARRPVALVAVLSLVAGLLTIIGVTSAPPAQAAVRQGFTDSFNTQDNGAIVNIGNSQMTCPAAAANCLAARSAAPSTGANNNNANNNYNMEFVDRDSDASTSNSSSADLSIPAGSTVLYAVLTWGGRTTAGTGGTAAGNRTQAKFRTPGGGYQTVTGALFEVPAVNGTPFYTTLDVTSLVRTAGSGTYWLADMSAATGDDRYAGWTLTVVYRNPSLPLRDLRVFQGFADVTRDPGNSPVDVPITGFLTPATGPVNAQIGFVSWEGDRGITGDGASLVNGGTVTPLSDAARPANNFFDASISNLGTNVTTRNPNDANAFGVDIAAINATGIIPNEATSTTVRAKTVQDAYFLTQVSTQIDLFTPAFNAVSKTVTNLSGNNPAQPGDVLEYGITFTNTGGDFADNAVVRDVLPANTAFVPGSVRAVSGTVGTAAYDGATRTLRVPIGAGAGTSGGTLDPGASASFVFRVTVQRAAAGTTLANTPELEYRARTIGKNYVFTGNTVTTPVQQLADLRIAKVSNPASQAAGNNVTYTLTVSNDGPNTASNVVTRDTLPSGVTFVSANPPAGTSCSRSGSTITCSTASLANGGTLSIPITVTIPPGTAAGTLTNSATVGSDTADDNTGNNAATATTTVTNLADVSLTKTGNPTTVTAGNNVTYTITARNAGPSTATGVQINDVLPANTTLVSADPANQCNQSGNTVTCNVGSLAPNATATVTVVVSTLPAIPTGSTLTNSATVSTATPESSTANNSATATTQVVTSADLAVIKTAAPGTFVAGQSATYTIRVTNNGPSRATNARLTDALPDGFTPTSVSSTVGSCTTGQTVDCQFGALAVGNAAIVQVNGTVDSALAAGTTLANSATATSDTPDPNEGNNTGRVSNQVATSADLALSKAANPSTIVFGEPVEYLLTVRNDGPSVAAGVITSDPLPAGFTFAGSPDGCTIGADNTVSCDVGQLAVGASRTVRFTANTPADGTGNASNTATVTASTPDPNEDNNTATAVADGASSADLAIRKTTLTQNPGTDPTNPDRIQYQLDVVNNGPSAAAAVTVTDTLPEGVTFTSATGASCAPGAANPREITCTVGALAGGGTARIVLTGSIGAAVSGPITNTATVGSSTSDPSGGNNTSAVTDTVQPTADMAVTLEALTPTVVAGDDARYRLTVVNNGHYDATGVVVTGVVPPGLTPNVGSSGGACTVSGVIVTCTLGTVPAGSDPIVIEFTATVNSSTPAGTISATATVGSQTPDLVPDNNSSTATFQVITQADLAVEKTVDPNPLIAGNPATYTIKVTNNGPSDAVNATLADTIPAGLTPRSANASIGRCTLDGQQVACTAARIPAGQVWTIQVPVQVASDADGTVTNSATADSDTADPDEGNNTGSVEAPISTRADLRLTKSASPTTAVAGASISYTLTLTNAGPSDAEDVEVTDTLPAGLTVLENRTPPGCQLNTARTTVTCAFGSVAAGSFRTVVFDALVPQDAAPGSTLTNRATATSSTTDPTPDDATATVDTPVTAAADVQVTKSAVNDPVEAGTQQRYLISVSNSGPSQARGVVLSDPIPAGTSFVSAAVTGGRPGQCALDGSTLQCNLGDLASGSSTTVEVVVDVASNIAGTTLSNTAKAGSRPTTGEPTPDPNTDNNTSTVSELVAARSDLQLQKELIGGPVQAGGTVSYRVTLTNGGPSDAANAFVRDPLPSGLGYVSSTASDDGTCSLRQTPTGQPGGPYVYCSWPTVPNGASRTIEITLSIPADTEPGTTLINTVTGGSDSIDPKPPTATNDDAVVQASADLVTTKTSLTSRPVAGGPIQWQVTVLNRGPSVATGVTLTDPVPAGVTLTGDPVTAQGSCSTANGPITCTLGTLAPGATATVVINGTLAADFAGTSVVNRATADSATPDPDEDNNTGTATTPVVTAADLTVSKSASPSPLTAGSPVTWTIVASNPQGPSDASNVTITDTLPDGVTGLTASVPGGDCTITGRQLRCVVPSIEAAGSATVTVRGTVAAGYSGSTLDNTVTVDSDTPDPDLTNNDAGSSTPVDSSADVSISKTGPAGVAAGGAIEWTLTVANAGPSDATDVRISDTLPAGVTGARATLPGGASCPIDGSTVSCSLGTLPAGDSVQITVSGTVASGTEPGDLRNAATVTAATADPDEGNNTDDAVTAVTTSADLQLSKTLLGTATAGQPASWLVTVTNAGPSDARAVRVTDTLPDGITDVSGSFGTDGTCDVSGQQLSCAVGDLAAGAGVQVTVTGTLAPGFGAIVSNTATVGSSTGDPNTDDNTATSTDPVNRSADLGVAKRITSGPPVAGEPITFEVEVTNNGPSDATDVTVTDRLPAQLTGASARLPGGAPCPIADGVATCALGTVTNGQTVVVTVTGTVGQDFDTDLTNTASVSSPVTDPKGSNDTTSVTATVGESADLSVTKTGPDTAVPGTDVSWQVTVSNAGPSAARGVSLTESVPAGVADALITLPDGSTCDPSDVCLLGGLNPGERITVTVTGRLASGYSGSTLVNGVSVTAQTPDPDSTGNSATSTTPVQRRSRLTVDKKVEPSPLVPGAAASYTVTVGNAGPSDAPNPVLTDTLPDGVEPAGEGASASQGSCQLAGRTVNCELGPLGAGKTATVTIPVRVDAGVTSPISNTATVDDPFSPPATGSTTDQVTPRADLNVRKSGPQTLRAGEPVAWTIRVSNTGPSTAADVVLTDRIPAGVLSPEVTTSSGTCAITDGALRCDLGSMPPSDDGAITVTLTGRLDPTFTGDKLENTATVTSPTPEPEGGTGGRSSTATTAVTAAADLQLWKRTTTETAAPGQQVTWIITARNHGPSTARDVVITERPPDDFTIDTITPSVGSCSEQDGGGYRCTVGDIAPEQVPDPSGNDVIITVTGTISPDATGDDNKLLVNTVSGVTSTDDPTPGNNEATSPITLQPDAGVSLTKTASPQPLVAGGPVTWTLTASNAGPSSATDLVLTDQLPAGVTDVQIADPGAATCKLADGTLTCTLDRLRPNENLVVVLRGTVTPGYDRPTLTNTAVLTAVGDPNPDDNTATDATAVTTSADLSIRKAGPATAVAGEHIAWTLTVRNDGPSVARAVQVSDPAPRGVSGVSLTTDAGSCDGTACQLGDLAPGAEAQITVRGTVDAGTTDPVVNTATVTSTAVDGGNPATPDPDDDNNTATTTTPIGASADLALTKTVSPDPLQPGGTVTYTLTASNAGPSAATSVEFTDQVPAEITGVAATLAGADPDACTVTDNRVSCTAPSVAPGGTAEVRITGTLAADAEPGTISNTASVLSPTPDPNPNNNTATVGADTDKADLRISKTTQQRSVLPGGELTWTITVTNSSATATARSVQLTDALPAGFAFGSATASSGSCNDAAGGPLLCALGNLAPGATATVTVTGTVAADAVGSLTNTASVVSPDEANPDDNTATVTTPITPTADLTVSKAAVQREVVAGGTVDWRITVRNAGPAPARDVVLTDTLPRGLSATAPLPAGCAATGSTVRCTVGDLAAGADRQFTLRTAVAASVRDEVANAVTVSSSTQDPDPGSNGGSGTVTVLPPGTPPPTSTPSTPPPSTPAPSTPPTGTTNPTGTEQPPVPPTGTWPTGTPQPPTSVPPPPCPECPGGDLPNTGAPLDTLSLWAALMLLLGAGLIVLGHRRRRSS